MSGLSNYRVTEQDKKLFELCEHYNCDHTYCEVCPYDIRIAGSNISFCALTYISNRIISARESEG